MRSIKIHIITGLLFLTVFLQAYLCAQTGPGGAPYSTIPPNELPLSAQQGQGGLVPSPNPIDRSSNLTVTGNVRGGRYFHDSVPYSSSRYYEGTLPSSSLDSFIRDSTGPADIGSFTGGNRPYYSPSQTVTTTRPGTEVVTRPPNADIGGYVTTSPVFGTSSTNTQITPNTTYVMPSRASWPMSMTLPEIEEQISSEIDTSLLPEEPTEQQNQTLPEQVKESIEEQLSDKTPYLRENLTTKNKPLLPSIERKQPEKIPEAEAPAEKKPPEEYIQSPETPVEPWQTEETQVTNEPDNAYGQVKQQLEELNKKIDSALTKRKTEEQNKELPWWQDEDDTGSLSQSPHTAARRGYKMSQDDLYQQDIYAPKIAEIDPSIAAKAKEILGPYHTYTSFSETNYNKNMAAAEYYLKKGRYYRAADAYTLASVYKPDDPLAYAGRSHALLASGEYMSSALFLARTLEIYPKYAQLKIDIQTMTGGSENLKARIADIEDWLSRSDAPELHFLLAHVYYQMNELKSAKKEINAAYEKAPDTPAVLILKKAIEGGL